jgi:hypothetical protein
MKKPLLAIAIILTITGIVLAYDILRPVGIFLLDNPLVMLAVVLAVGVQLLGHLLRALRTKIVLDQAAPSSAKFQFGALSTGYLFNTLLPFRLGELIRALLVARRLRISLLYTFTAVVIERVIDVILLGVLVIVGALAIGFGLGDSLVIFAILMIFVSVLLLGLLISLKNENKLLLAFVARVSRLFNTPISNSIRFKVWSLIYGMQSFLGDTMLVKRYVGFALLSWLCYFASALIVVIVILPGTGLSSALVAAVSPYVSVFPIFTPLDATSYQQLSQVVPAALIGSEVDMYARIMWAVLILPTAFIGLVALFYYREGSLKVTKKTKNESYVNKLLRHEDISQELPAFLETYFNGFALTRTLHKIELNGELSLVKFFKGGSDAVTVLALQKGEMYVKKIVPIEFADRLSVQYDWLKKFNSKKAIVDVIGEHRTDDYYAIDLSYDPANIALFEYVHTRSLKQSKKAIHDVWTYVFKHIYKLDKESFNPRERDEYVQDRLMNKIKKAILVNDDLKEVTGAETIVINGEHYDNFYAIIDKIKKHKKAWNDIATYRKSNAIHGDLTIDNILVDTKTDKPVIIDPSDDNQIRGPIIDLARHTQSLIAGYEFLNADDEPVKSVRKQGVVTINYHDRKSARYMQLYDYVKHEVTPSLFTDTEQRTVLFHAGLLYGRMLAHRVVINPHNTLKYYAICVVLLNEFYRQYKS